MCKVSPLFALDAEELFDLGKIDEAIELCKSGVSSYPDYFAGYSILVQLLIKSKDFQSAEVFVNEAEANFPDNSLINQFRTQIENSSSSNNIDDELIESVQPDDNNQDEDISISLHTDENESLVADAEIAELSDYSRELEAVAEQLEEAEEIYLADGSSIELDDNIEISDEYIPIENSDADFAHEITHLEDTDNSDEEFLISNDEIVSAKDIVEEAISDNYENDVDDNEYISPKKLTKGFLAVLASRQADVKLPYRASDKSILPGLLDYSFFNPVEKNEYFGNGLFISDFDIKSIEKKYSKKTVSSDDFSELASKIKMMDIKPVISEYEPALDDENDEESSEYNGPATETIANILTLQKAYSQAISVYEKLIIEKPHKESEYQEKIVMLTDKINETQNIGSD